MCKGQNWSNDGERNRSDPFCPRLIPFALFVLPTWTIGAENSPGENIICNKEDLQHASKGNPTSHADTDSVSCCLCTHLFDDKGMMKMMVVYHGTYFSIKRLWLKINRRVVCHSFLNSSNVSHQIFSCWAEQQKLTTLKHNSRCTCKAKHSELAQQAPFNNVLPLYYTGTFILHLPLEFTSIVYNCREPVKGYWWLPTYIVIQNLS